MHEAHHYAYMTLEVGPMPPYKTNPGCCRRAMSNITGLVEVGHVTCPSELTVNL